MTGINISGYRICETTGSGKTGTVFRAVCEEDGLPRAVKQFQAMAIDRDFLHRNYQRLSVAPSHPGIVGVSEFEFSQAPYHVAMEWVEDSSSTLEGLSVPLPEDEAWPLIQEMAESMAHLHRQGVRHGNLHPGNVFLTPDAEPQTRLTDFGSGLVGRIHYIDLAETAWFAPPEQLENPDHYRDGAMEQWDVYRFGALAFWLINGVVPRGHRYREIYRRSLGVEDGRQVACDVEALAYELRGEPGYEWSAPAQTRADQLRREIIDRCLAIDPSERPVDMREVWTSSEKLESQFELEETQVRVCEERVRQLGKLRFTRAVAAGLAAGLVAVSVILLSNFQKNRSLHQEVGDLSSVVDRQKGTIDDYELRWSESLKDLKEFRSAAGSIFSQMSKSDATPGEEDGIEHEVLEKSRAYFEKTLGDLGESSPDRLERARCFHNLAHVEAQLGNDSAAQIHYHESAALFEAIAEERSEEPAIVGEIEVQLLDCYERLSGFIEPDPGDEKLATLRRATDLLAKVRLRQPDDRELAVREAIGQLALGRQLHAHRRFEEAIEVFASAGEGVSALSETALAEAMLSDLLSQIQFHAASSLREAGHHPEAIDSYLAAMETIAEDGKGKGYTREQRRQLGHCYAELGELFAEHAEGDEIKNHFNEAVRLLTPLCEGGAEDPRTAIFLSRSMAQIARLEREASHWTDGYRMSLAAIENLEAALENHPGDVDCQLALSDLRVRHTETLRYNRKAALRCLQNGLDMIGAVQDQIEQEEVIIEPIRRAWRERVAGIYDQYRELCDSFGETEKAKQCSDRANRARELLVQGEAAEQQPPNRL